MKHFCRFGVAGRLHYISVYEALNNVGLKRRENLKPYNKFIVLCCIYCIKEL